ncbi:MAG: GDYXXLXY domain-containing protein [Gammaproteobacteria bacterium]|nr:GDYXXLXY domain-containing protein [Gammaproteobacteria bacterium]
MNTLTKGLVVAAVQVLLVGSVGAKFLIDRANYPRVWVETAPYDPDLPIRGRYVRIAALVDVKRSETPDKPGTPDGPVMFAGRLEVQGERLVAIKDDYGRHWVSSRRCGESQCWQLDDALAYFIPEHVADPSRRPAGETLWVEVTVPPNGAPRPIRLGVRNDGQLTPLELR